MPSVRLAIGGVPSRSEAADLEGGESSIIEALIEERLEEVGNRLVRLAASAGNALGWSTTWLSSLRDGLFRTHF